MRGIGFQVESVEEVRKRIESSPSYLYPGEPPIKVQERSGPHPYKTFTLKDPDGNIVDFTDEGWEV